MRGQGGMRPLIGGNDEGRELLIPRQAKFSFPCFFQFPPGLSRSPAREKGPSGPYRPCMASG
ncbi:hypothetical protein CXU20_07750 [Akkermansia muciniphila]|nr:hypothetical protein CXU20_07750 [Akkermansia muciniphila]